MLENEKNELVETQDSQTPVEETVEEAVEVAEEPAAEAPVEE